MCAVPSAEAVADDVNRTGFAGNVVDEVSLDIAGTPCIFITFRESRVLRRQLGAGGNFAVELFFCVVDIVERALKIVFLLVGSPTNEKTIAFFTGTGAVFTD